MRLVISALLIPTLAAIGSAQAPPRDLSGAVTTYHNDLARTGQTASETILSPALLLSGNFGKVASYPVDGYVYAQPLYLPSVRTSLDFKLHNLIVVATENDSVYAFDPDTSVLQWKASFINPAKGVVPVPSTDVNTSDIVPQIGITGTPVIDPSTNTIYVVSKVKIQAPAQVTGYMQRLHALDASSGKEKFNGPTVIKAQYAGNCAPNDNAGHVFFSPLRQHNRAALVLYNGVIYIAFASHGDNDSYQGWLLGYSAADISQQVSVLNTIPSYTPGFGNECRGGIWQGGAGSAIDASGNMYFATGNGPFNVSTGGSNYGDSVVRVPPGGISIADYFTPTDQASLNNADTDLGSGGVLVLPDQQGPFPHLLISVGKEGSIYVLNRDSLGHFDANNDVQIPQYLPFAVGGVWGMPTYWNNNLYFGGSSDSIKSFSVINGVLSSAPVSVSITRFGFRDLG